LRDSRVAPPLGIKIRSLLVFYEIPQTLGFAEARIHLAEEVVEGVE
jgi:hypothetical protein